jgi:outer membrane receptor protein involved in Fe transport
MGMAAKQALVWIFLPSVACAQAVTPARAGVEKVTVVAKPRPEAGGGLMSEEKAAKSVSTVSSVFIAKQSPTSNAFDLLRLVPGANVASSDPYGLSPSVNITVRGLNGDEIAYVLEGAPLNDIGYYAGYPSQWADAENLKTVSLAQGTADLDSPTVNAGGGLINLSLRDPAAAPGGQVSGSYGSYHLGREFLRLDTGILPGTGFSAFVSFSNTNDDNWRGAGSDSRRHIDYKLLETWGDGNRIAVAGSYHDAILSSYPSPTLQQWNTYGRSYNYDATFNPGDTNYWKLYQQPWRDVQLSVPTHLTLADNIAFETAPYFQHGFGNTPYGIVLPTIGLYNGVQPIAGTLTIPNAQNGQGLVMADYIGNQFRAGVTSKIIATVGVNTFVAGWWYDYADDYDPEPYTPVSLSGTPFSVWGFPFTIKLPNGHNLSSQEAHTLEQANALFVGDTISLLGARLQIDAGLKYAMVNRQGTNNLPGPQYRVGLNSSQPLPRAAVRWQVTPEQELFASVSTNFRSPVEYALYNTYDIFGGPLLGRGTNLRDEYSISEEVGYRYQGGLLDLSVSFFNYTFTNRQVSTITGANQIQTDINAGGQTSRGFDAEAGLRPVAYWRPYVSAEYLRATIDNNFPIAGTYLPTAGKTAVRSPAFQGAIGLDYDNGRYFGNLAVKYVGSQYATFMNDEQIPGHTQADAALGARLPDIGFAKHPEARLNLINLTDAKFLSGMASVAPSRAYGAPLYYVGPGFAAVLTVSSGF